MTGLAVGGVVDAVRDARASSTRETYRTYVRQWIDWCDRRGLVARPAEPMAVAEWLVGLASAGKSVSTLRVAKAAVAAAHKESGLDDPTATELVTRCLSGLARRAAQAGRVPRQAKGLTADLLERVLAALVGPCAPRDRALLLTMRDGMLRAGEAAAVEWDDISLRADGTGRLLIRRSKTDQHGRGSVLWLSQRTMHALAALDGTSGRVFPISRPYVTMRLSLLCDRAGLGPGYSGHSPRVGMAQDLAAAGYSLTQLMTAGRWADPSMPARYTRNEDAARNAVAQWHQQFTI